MHYLESILRVLAIGLVLGAGLPALFAVGLVAFSSGAGGETEDGALHAPNPVLKALGLVLFAVVGLVIVMAILWITRSTIVHHFNVDPFWYLPKK
ncbi:hypothetical protein [Mycolicibacterium brumae]|uniref:Transmembrane protein n=1 Tax=Mycolicibacterium brumae TaxID=85968 RepID=A0A2G5PGW1_9MYCO|nr:hypothetical protein [Mycolicibacterium brumae]MCV7192444.1 hypothetical protein [Mycolicibacterium brumae]PIB77546.1 hypothetical protein CQY22_000870 [Mycolicibacterium brumae]RWA18563.1 hypothetical protein MBRU_04910 [Mycolicibacterium brumae DSM 44177]UWW10212.1 hypothetical protein L2Z93_003339 [Mycolicibacterium brumae]